MTNILKNKITLFILLIVLVQLLTTGCKNNGVNTIDSSPKNGEIKLTLYFPDEKDSLIIEERVVNLSNKLFSDVVINELIKGRATGEKFLPEGTKLISTKQEKDTVTINFSKEFLNGKINSSYSNSLIIYAIVNSLTESDSIKYVKIVVDDKIVEDFNGFNISNPIQKNSALSDAAKNSQTGTNVTLKLYFLNPNMSSYEFVTETRVVNIPNLAVARTIVLELIKGSNKYGTIIPSGTKLLDIYLKESIIYVDFSEEFVKNNNLGSGYETMMIYSIVNSLTELKTISKVQFLVNGKIREANKHVYIKEPLSRDLNPIGNDSNNSEETTIRKLSDETLYALKQKDMNSFSGYVHPDKGIRFTAYAYINTSKDIVFTKQEAKNLLSNTKKYKFGVYDGIGTDIYLTFLDYYKRFVYDQDFLNAPQVSYNSAIGGGNSINNIKSAYPDGKFVEYHFPGFEEKYDGMDWRSLRLVFEKSGSTWYLVGIVHDEWTI